ncbi:lipopolysaccharide transport periplasmic protein LptA [Undibacterium curvum]|uniref:lipopolysaccharide transport periplasmic protein LptA n=1 Tax=Undibacterium curvum TaxID=2762294 RepID=UPI003D12809C
MRHSLRHLITVASLLLSCTLSPFAHAEKADALKDAVIEAGKSFYDLKKNLNVLSLGVTITRGTLLIQADNATIQEEKDGTQIVTLLGKNHGLITFRQKMDGPNERWLEGEAEKAVYNEKTEIVVFTTRAKVRNIEANKVMQEQFGEYLSYDSRNEVLTGTNSVSGEHDTSKPRTQLILRSKSASGTTQAQ